MKNKSITKPIETFMYQYPELPLIENKSYPIISQIKSFYVPFHQPSKVPAEILFITSYPPRECGIATYSEDLISALNNKFSNALSIKVCALESNGNTYPYPKEVIYTLKTSIAQDYEDLAQKINKNNDINMVLIQHEFGFFNLQDNAFLKFLFDLTKPIAIVFHTVLPHPDGTLKLKIKNIASVVEAIIVMTNNSAKILKNDYGISDKQISVIAHGTHLVQHLRPRSLKQKHGLKDRIVLTTFGLLSSGKSIETTIEALPSIIKQCPEVVFLIIGKTHPEVVKSEGEKYRQMLEQKVKESHLENHVVFLNVYMALPLLLEYLQLTDIYIFTTNDPNQAVSGTFAYAMSCACPIISTPIPHAIEVLTKDTGIIFDFRNSTQLADCAIRLIKDKPLRKHLSTNALQKIVSTAWENSAISHAIIIEEITKGKIMMQYNLPEINLNHLKKMSTDIGMIQFSKINQPDIRSGYTLDDNARALIVSCMYYKLTGDKERLKDVRKYLQFILFCQQANGNFFNYVDKNKLFTDQNNTTNLDDASGRAVWALGFFISLKDIFPEEWISEAENSIQKSLNSFETVTSTRAMAFAIKGIYHYQKANPSAENITLIKTLANRLVQMFRHESTNNWSWFESYLTYANSILPEALLYAWHLTGEKQYKEIAISSFDFLLKQTFNDNGIEVISNKNWLQKEHLMTSPQAGGEQPIDVAYTIMTLSLFYDTIMNKDYLDKMVTAFNWFLGKNRLHQIIYNPCTGGCYDGVEDANINLNQGAESTVSYLMARLTIEKYKNDLQNSKTAA